MDIKIYLKEWHILKHGVRSDFGVEPWCGVDFGVEIWSDLRWLCSEKISGKITMLHIFRAKISSKGANSDLWQGLAWPYYVKWHNSMLDDIILWTKPGQVYILELTQFSY